MEQRKALISKELFKALHDIKVIDESVKTALKKAELTRELITGLPANLKGLEYTDFRGVLLKSIMESVTHSLEYLNLTKALSKMINDEIYNCLYKEPETLKGDKAGQETAH